MMIVTGEDRARGLLRRLGVVGLIMLAVSAPLPGLAQPAPNPQIAPPAAAPATEGPSLGHAALNATTYKILTTLTGLTLYTYGTGSIFGGVGLAAFNTAQAWLAYTATDYSFDRYWPKTPDAQGNFDISTSAQRNTSKFLIYESIVTPIKFLSLYVYTESTATSLMISTASLLVNSIMFYANNTIWDWIDWEKAAVSSVALPSVALQMSPPLAKTRN